MKIIIIYTLINKTHRLYQDNYQNEKNSHFDNCLFIYIIFLHNKIYNHRNIHKNVFIIKILGFNISFCLKMIWKNWHESCFNITLKYAFGVFYKRGW